MISSTASISRLPTDYPATTMPAQMSSWLVFSMVGFYPVCPGMPYYVIGSPSFEESVITLENGKKFTIEAKGASEKNIYIQSATLNGQPYDKSYILHKDIMNGGILSFVMGDSPNKEWASSAGSLPPSRGYKERRIKKSFTYSCSASPSYQTQGRNFQYREGSGKNRKGNLRGINIAFLLNFIIFTR